jgi:hypothetical protein
MRPSIIFALILAAPVFFAVMSSEAQAAEANTLQSSQLYSAKTGKASKFACFERKYDDAHLASHPHQNVRIMRLFAQKDEDPSYPSSRLAIGVYFRDVKKRFDIIGSCSPDKDHPGALACGIDCDGGRFGLRQNGADTLLVDIPTGVQASIDGPDGPERSSQANHKAKFGSDDQTFRLERVDLKECASMDEAGEMKN